MYNNLIDGSFIASADNAQLQDMFSILSPITNWFKSPDATVEFETASAPAPQTNQRWQTGLTPPPSPEHG
jgi:hypothetical protein